MNVESYTIIFLTKQKYLNLPGIGNFRLIKENGEEKISFSPVSIIDDLFASFIGVNENVSSNNAANAISRYSKEIKNSLKEGKIVNIPGLGSLQEDNDRILFTQESEDTFLKPAENKNYRELTFGKGSLPTQGVPQIQGLDEDDEDYFDEDRQDGINFETETYNPAYDSDTQREELQKKERSRRITRGLLTAVLILGIIGVLIWAFYNFLNNRDNSQQATTPTSTEEVQNTEAAAVATGDSTASAAVSNSATWQIVTKTYDSEISADKRQKQLSDYGWNVEKSKCANGNYDIVVNIPNDGRNTEDVLDSVRKVLNPSGKVYIKE